jgi:hypothetical protein
LTNPSGFVTSAALAPYLTSATAASTYYPLTNPAGYITASALTSYLTTASAALTYEPIITPGTTSQYWRGDKSWQTLDTSVVSENTNLYFTNARAIAAPLTGYVSGAGTISATDSILQAIQKLSEILLSTLHQGTTNPITTETPSPRVLRP